MKKRKNKIDKWSIIKTGGILLGISRDSRRDQDLFNESWLKNPRIFKRAFQRI